MAYKNKEDLYKNQVQRWINRKIKAVESMGGLCKDCGLTLEDSHYSIFEFHHLDSSEKGDSWTKLRLKSQEAIDKELSKCVLLCANCHRLRHALSY